VTSRCYEWGRWHLEAEIGKCTAPYAPVLKTPEAAGAWVEKSGMMRRGSASRRGLGRLHTLATAPHTDAH
jgi:hypothetical protein